MRPCEDVGKEKQRDSTPRIRRSESRLLEGRCCSGKWSTAVQTKKGGKRRSIRTNWCGSPIPLTGHENTEVGVLQQRLIGSARCGALGTPDKLNFGGNFCLLRRDLRSPSSERRLAMCCDSCAEYAAGVFSGRAWGLLGSLGVIWGGSWGSCEVGKPLALEVSDRCGASSWATAEKGFWKVMKIGAERSAVASESNYGSLWVSRDCVPSNMWH